MGRKDKDIFKQPTTSGRRMFRLAGTSANIARRWVTASASNLFRGEAEKEVARKALYSEIGKELVATLGEMKGAVMKVGQILSQIKDFLPEEVSIALGELREYSVAMSYEMVSAQIFKEFGQSPSELFLHFESEPYKAASLGQVHRAKLKSGEEVVVKVQYPGVRGACESDLRQLHRLLRLMGVVKIEKSRLDAIFEKINQMITRELDFKEEAAQLKRFAEFHKDHDFVVIPSVIEHLSGDEVLTMGYVPGHSLIELQESNDFTEKQQVLRNTVAENLFKLFSEEILYLNAAHLDPHAGNFSYQDDGSIIMYDFGAVADFDADVISSLQSLLAAVFSNDHLLIDRLLVQRRIKRSQKALSEVFYREWIEIIQSPFMDKAFDFGQSDLHIRCISKLKADWRIHMTQFAPMPDSLLLDRLIVGQYWNLVRLGAKVKLKPLLDHYVLNAWSKSLEKNSDLDPG